MRTLSKLALCALALVPAPALAQDTANSNRRIEMLGTSPVACVTGNPSATNATNATFSASGATGGQVQIVEFVDPTTAAPLPSTINLALPVTCNASHELLIRSANGGLLREGGSTSNRQRPDGFADFVTYSVSLQWAGQALQGTSDAGTLALNTADAMTGTASLQIDTPSGGGPLTAGRFDDTLIIEFRPSN